MPTNPPTPPSPSAEPTILYTLKSDLRQFGYVPQFMAVVLLSPTEMVIGEWVGESDIKNPKRITRHSMKSAGGISHVLEFDDFDYLSEGVLRVKHSLGYFMLDSQSYETQIQYYEALLNLLRTRRVERAQKAGIYLPMPPE